VVQAYASSPAKPKPKPTDPSPAKKRKAKEIVPPDVGAIPPASTDIDNLLKDAEDFLIKTDPKLEKVVRGHQCGIFSPEGLREIVSPFESLGKGIIGQQVCGSSYRYLSCRNLTRKHIEARCGKSQRKSED
jgi:DNA-3-methyladenine glycosylase II